MCFYIFSAFSVFFLILYVDIIKRTLIASVHRQETGDQNFEWFLFE